MSAGDPYAVAIPAAPNVGAAGGDATDRPELTREELRAALAELTADEVAELLDIDPDRLEVAREYDVCTCSDCRGAWGDCPYDVGAADGRESGYADGQEAAAVAIAAELRDQSTWTGEDAAELAERHA